MKEFCGNYTKYSSELWTAIDSALPRITKWGELSDTPQFLGAGGYGGAARFGNKTLKISCDKEEATNAALVHDHPHPNVYCVHKVARALLLSVSDLDVYAIVYDYLEKPTKVMRQVAHDVYFERFDCASRLVTGWPSAAYAIFPRLDPKSEYYRCLEEMIAGLTHLRRIGIEFTDCHEDNVMRKDNHLVIIDVGMSPSGKNPHLDILERRNV